MEKPRVSEWKQRKAAHAPDPIAALRGIGDFHCAGGGNGNGIADGGGAAAAQSQPPTTTTIDTTGPCYVARAGRVVVARAGRVVVARSSNVQHANQRVYFPPADCVLAWCLPFCRRRSAGAERAANRSGITSSLALGSVSRTLRGATQSPPLGGRT